MPNSTEQTSLGINEKSLRQINVKLRTTTLRPEDISTYGEIFLDNIATAIEHCDEARREELIKNYIAKCDKSAGNLEIEVKDPYSIAPLGLSAARNSRNISAAMEMINQVAVRHHLAPEFQSVYSRESLNDKQEEMSQLLKACLEVCLEEIQEKSQSSTASALESAEAGAKATTNQASQVDSATASSAAASEQPSTSIAGASAAYAGPSSPAEKTLES